MGVQEVQGAKEVPAYQKKQRAGSGEGFQKSLLQNIRSREQEEDETADAAQIGKQTKKLSETGRIGVTNGVRVNAAILTEAVQTAKVQHMRYEESDHVEIAVAEGYTLKGKHLEKGGQVYVEAKYDDGRLEAYQVNVERISQDTTHTIERFALETMRET